MESSVFRGLTQYFQKFVGACSSDTREKSVYDTSSTACSKLTHPTRNSTLESFATDSLCEGSALAQPIPQIRAGAENQSPIADDAFKIRDLDTGKEIDIRDENRPSFAGHLANILGVPLDDLENFYTIRRARNAELLQAAHQGNAQRCRELLDKKINGNLAAGINSRGPSGETALHCAAKEGHEEVCSLLLMSFEGIDVNAKMKDGRTPLHLASERGHFEIVKLMLLFGGSVNALDCMGNSPLHLAARYGRTEIVLKLLERYADPMIVNRQGFNAVELASKELAHIIVERTDPVVKVVIRDCDETQEDSQNEMQFSTRERVGEGNFEIINMLGKGSFGQVFLVKKLDDGCYYALKVLNKRQITQNNLLKYAMTEKNVLSYIRHPFIVSLRYAFQTPQKLCLVLDYCPGGDLGSILSREKKFSEELTRLYAAEILLALEHLHSLNIIYRDLKPDNVILDADGHAMLTDFGLSKEGIDSSMTTQSFCGSIAYLAPEILSRQGHGKPVDWYLLGVMMYEMMVGFPPYFNSKREIMFKNIQSGPLTLPNYLSQSAKDLLRKLLNRDPNRRLGALLDAEEIKRHPFFKKVDWGMVARREQKMPRPSRHSIVPILIDSSRVYGDLEDLNRAYVEGWTFIAS